MKGPSGGATDALKSTLTDLIRPVVEDHGAVLVDVELLGADQYRTVRVLVHRDSGVTVEICGAISLELGDLLDVEDPLPGRYRLEVTSPGLDRPLTTDGDYRRAQGRKVKVVMNSGKSVVGRLESCEEDAIRIATEKEIRAIARREIAKAQIEVEF